MMKNKDKAKTPSPNPPLLYKLNFTPWLLNTLWQSNGTDPDTRTGPGLFLQSHPCNPSLYKKLAKLTLNKLAEKCLLYQ